MKKEAEEPNIDWWNLPDLTMKGWEVTHHSYSDTYTLRKDGREIVQQLNSMNSQGDRYIHWVENGYLNTACQSSSDKWGEYGTHSKFVKIAERLSGMKFMDMLRK